MQNTNSFIGRITYVSPLQSGESAHGTWNRIEFEMVETEGMYPQSVLLRARGDLAKSIPGNVVPNDGTLWEAKIGFASRSYEKDGGVRRICDVNCWSLGKVVKEEKLGN